MGMREAHIYSGLSLALGTLLGLGAWSLAAGAELDFSRATMGRTTYPAGSWVLDTSQRYSMAKAREASADTFQAEAELEHGVTERLTWEAGLESTDVRRDAIQPGHGVLAARYMALASPFQIAPVAEYRPSLRMQADEWEFGVEALKNYEQFSLIFQGMGESSKDPGGPRSLQANILVGPLYRFGLNGIAGVQWLYVSDGTNYIASQIGGAVSKNIFLGVAPRFGLSRRSTDFQIGVKLHFYFGDYRRQAFGLD